MTHDERAAYRHQALAVLMPSFMGPSLPAWFETLLRNGLGAVCLYADNIHSPAQLVELTAAIRAANPNAIIAIDEEGGDVSRLHQEAGSPFPGNAVLGRLDDVDATRSVGHEVGRQLAEAGVHLTLAPDADVNSNPDNPVIGVRSFGADHAAVASHTAAWVGGVQAAGVAACAKHFPGHGDTAADSHLAVALVTADAATLAERDLVPFRAAIDAGTKTIMTSHILVPALDPDHVATFSRPILHDLLRDQLGFDGAVVTDALDMAGASADRGIPAAAVAALAAGSDLLCLGPRGSEADIHATVEAVVDAVDSGVLDAERLADAVERGRELGSWLDRNRPGSLTAPDAGHVISPEIIATTFSLSARARAELASAGRRVRWVEIEPEANIAIGSTPFGPFFDGGVRPALVVPVDDRGVEASLAPDSDTLTLVVGRELHRDHDAHSVAMGIIGQTDGLLVDMGFVASEDVDVATFGASRLVGEALIRLVEGPS